MAIIESCSSFKATTTPHTKSTVVKLSVEFREVTDKQHSSPITSSKHEDVAEDDNKDVISRKRKLKAACEVCDGEANGYHYGAITCESCCSFFRRNTKNQFECEKDNQCSVKKQDRHECPSCRFQKCLAIGMDMGIVKREKRGNLLKNAKEEWPETTSEIKELVDAFILTMPSSTNFTSPTHAIGALKKFIQSVPQLASAFPNEDKEVDFLIQGIMSGLLVIRAAFTFDPIGFIQNGQLEQRINLLRMGIRNSVFTDGEVALLSGIYILQAVTGASSKIFPTYCQGLRDHFGQSHPQEVGIYDRIVSKLGPRLIQ